jgi:hypothetical protein
MFFLLERHCSGEPKTQTYTLTFDETQTYTNRYR